MRKVISIVFGLLFVLFAAFQYNDPDPLVWVPIYLVAAIACFMAFAGVGSPAVYVAIAAGYVVAAIYQWPPRFEGFLFSEIGMRSTNIELAREAGGLAICAVVMVLLALLMRQLQSIRR
ncbi:transmembrane 220 family protein [Spirosoma luteum]|uniref:transmembrane 220 family protein n=1 Tax=Spirosoma luteum TaxID=431553 RepID=UPI00036B2BD8|nr:transmembrane 220 family protein [Spirosoma luteum]